MKFYELLNKYSNEQIIASLKKYYEDVKDEAYVLALTELRKLKPSEEPQDINICVEYAKDDLDEEDDNLYLHCDGIGLDKEGKEERWGLEFDCWEEWLAKDIECETLNNLDELTIIAGIIWEMTFNGYTPKAINDKKEILVSRLMEAEAYLETIEKDELED